MKGPVSGIVSLNQLTFICLVLLFNNVHALHRFPLHTSSSSRLLMTAMPTVSSSPSSAPKAKNTFFTTSTIQNIIGKTAKITVSSIAAYTIFSNEYWQPVYYISGAMTNGLITKAVKSITKQPRPAGSKKKGYGMPSSHASSLFYFSSVIIANSIKRPHFVSPTVAVIAVVYSAIASSWRIFSGLHTTLQTIVGALLGALQGYLTVRLEDYFMKKVGESVSMRVRVGFVLLCGLLLYLKEIKVFIVSITSRGEEKDDI
jgi:membrane-associated phospholipid phosphatase